MYFDSTEEVATHMVATVSRKVNTVGADVRSCKKVPLVLLEMSSRQKRMQKVGSAERQTGRRQRETKKRGTL